MSENNGEFQTEKEMMLKMYYKNLINQKIGNWTVLDIAKQGKGQTKMLCRCDCGTVRAVDSYSLYHRLTNSCGKCCKIISEGDYKRCIMKNGASFIFDPQDELLVRQHTWSITRGHIRTTQNGKTLYLHRLIMGAADNEQIDHINMDKTDNRRCNLRFANHAENQRNKGLRSDNTTGFKGVCFDKSKGKYIAYINLNGVRTYLGLFADKVCAAKAYDLAALKQHGEFARLNFGKEDFNGSKEILEMAQ